ncbi:MAG: hypothetical protein ACRETZ_16985 [Steroidobacteraceae bacterium]
MGIYLQCLRIVHGTKACQAVENEAGLYSVSGSAAACARVLARNDWSQSGVPEWSGAPRSLFHEDHLQAARLPSSGKVALHLPARVTLRGTIRTGFFLDCCTYGVGYVVPYAYLHLPRAITVSDWNLGTIPVQDIQLDRRVAGSEVEEPVDVSCRSLASGETHHYALRVYCRGTRIHLIASPR